MLSKPATLYPYSVTYYWLMCENLGHVKTLPLSTQASLLEYRTFYSLNPPQLEKFSIPMPLKVLETIIPHLSFHKWETRGISTLEHTFKDLTLKSCAMSEWVPHPDLRSLLISSIISLSKISCFPWNTCTEIRLTIFPWGFTLCKRNLSFLQSFTT